MILSPGSISISTSNFEQQIVQEVRGVADIASSPSGKQLLSPELLVSEDLFYRSLGQSIPTTLRGIEPVALQVHETLKIIEGGPPSANGMIMLGKKIAYQLGGSHPGDQIVLGAQSWTVAGVFEAKDSMMEGEVWVNLRDLQTATRRNNISTVLFKLNPALDPNAESGRLSSSPRIQAKVMPESLYYAEQTQDARRIWLLTLGLSSLLGIAAVFAGMNTMYAAVANREHEIGVLRALGYSRTDLLVSFSMESCLIALLGGILAVAITLMLNGAAINTVSEGNFLSFGLRATPSILSSGILLSLLLGLIGGFFPALKAARSSIVEAVRAA
jgi:ABC-type lipoprotein release transport system permease subunit